MSWARHGDPFTRARAVAIACGLLLGTGAARAQHVRIKNVTVAPRDARTATVRFDIAWDKSWRDKVNHDAAWVFFKVRAEGDTHWQHVRLAADKVLNPTGYGHERGAMPLDFIVPDGKDGFVGMFVRRAEHAAEGRLMAHGVTAVWDFTANKGVTEDTKISMRAFGIEMVYVPQGPFYLGSGGVELNGFYQYTDGRRHLQPYRVTSAGAIPTGRQKGRLWAWKGAQPQDNGEIPASFPNGYAAFYCMKHRITSAQYAGFLNTLPAAQADKRYHARMLTRSGKAPDYTYSAHRDRPRLGSACVGMSWADGAALAAWAGLRPMTELELAKAVRGPRKPVPDEVGPSYWKIAGFAGKGEYADWHAYKGCYQTERTVTVGNATGRKFAGTHGRGRPALPADWPREDAVGAGMRCSWYGFHVLNNRSELPRTSMSDYPTYTPWTEPGWIDLPRARLSDRLYAAFVDPKRRPYHHWRSVRTAPAGVRR